MSLTHVNSRCHVIMLKWCCSYLKCSKFKLVADFCTRLHFGFADLLLYLLKYPLRSSVTFYIVIYILMNINRLIKCLRIIKTFDWSLMKSSTYICHFLILYIVSFVPCTVFWWSYKFIPFLDIVILSVISSSWSHVHAIQFCVGKSFKFLFHCVYELIEKINLWSSHHLFLGQSVNVMQMKIRIKVEFGFEVDDRSNYRSDSKWNIYTSRRKRFKTQKCCDKPQKLSIKQTRKIMS